MPDLGRGDTIRNMETFLVLIGVLALLAIGGYRYTKANNAANAHADRIICPHCHVAGRVTVTLTSRKRGISGGKATGAVVTGGASVWLTGLSRREGVREMTCGNCGVTWDVA